MRDKETQPNIDAEVVQHFGKEWAKFSYSDGEADAALNEQFLAYTSPIDLLKFNPETSIAADFGAGSGRWTERLTPYFKEIYALEPSLEAVQVLHEKFDNNRQIKVLNESVEQNQIPDQSLDFAMSLGVLHHIPNTRKAIADLASKLKPGGTFLCYLYYKVEGKPIYYRVIFQIVNAFRFLISRLPHVIRRILAKLIAATIYLPLARYSKYRLKLGKSISNIPLHHYAEMPFVMLENDALDRFGTRLEQRFSKAEIIEMISPQTFDLSTLIFPDVEPFWTFAVLKKP